MSEGLKDKLKLPLEVCQDDHGDFVICDIDRRILLRIANFYFGKYGLEFAELITADLNEKLEDKQNE
jgi:hypothetical protein